MIRRQQQTTQSPASRPLSPEEVSAAQHAFEREQAHIDATLRYLRAKATVLRESFPARDGEHEEAN